MKAKGYAVIQYSNPSVLGVSFFTGKTALKEARKHFIKVVCEDLNDYHNSNGEDHWLSCSMKEILRLAKEDAKKMSYTSEDEGFDILIVEAD
jgi:hypothetical protein